VVLGAPGLASSSMQSSARIDAVDEFGVFILHTTHDALPVASLYVPPGHAEQLPAVPVNPLAQSG